MWSKIGEKVLIYIAVVFLLEAAKKAPQPPIESTLLRQEDVETLVGLIRDIRYDLSMQVRPYAFVDAIKNDNDDNDDDDDDDDDNNAEIFPQALPWSSFLSSSKTTTTIDTTSNKRRVAQ